ncbi:MAG: HEPN domain-containing protein [Actinomycetota bacterium]|nr:HEPN domain-containing protein [Actinomycetota bacterium]
MSGSREASLAWLAKARIDLSYSVALAAEESLPTWGACFHAQQAAEKAFKALLVDAGVDPPRTHNLVTWPGCSRNGPTYLPTTRRLPPSAGGRSKVDIQRTLTIRRHRTPNGRWEQPGTFSTTHPGGWGRSPRWCRGDPRLCHTLPSLWRT